MHCLSFQFIRDHGACNNAKISEAQKKDNKGLTAILTQWLSGPIFLEQFRCFYEFMWIQLALHRGDGTISAVA